MKRKSEGEIKRNRHRERREGEKERTTLKYKMV